MKEVKCTERTCAIRRLELDVKELLREREKNTLQKRHQYFDLKLKLGR